MITLIIVFKRKKIIGCSKNIYLKNILKKLLCKNKKIIILIYFNILHKNDIIFFKIVYITNTLRTYVHKILYKIHFFSFKTKFLISFHKYPIL